ncbi:MAG: helix-turn-helix domain-containing protein [Candidatus Limnocylindria bacterium]
MSGRSTWTEIKSERRNSSAVQRGYLAARANYRLAERVRALRESRGVSQQELADRLDTTQSVISRLEAGGTKPTLTTLERIGEALDAELVVEFADVVGRRESALSAAVSAVGAVRVRRRSPIRYGKKAAKKAKSRR